MTGSPAVKSLALIRMKSLTDYFLDAEVKVSRGLQTFKDYEAQTVSDRQPWPRPG